MTEKDLLAQADALYRHGEYSMALRLYEQARPYKMNRIYQAFLDKNVAQCLRRTGHAREALSAAEVGISRLDGMPPTATLGHLLTTKANCAADLGRHEEALQFLRQAERAFAYRKDQRSLQQVLIARSRSLAEMERTEEAANILHSLQQAELPSEIKSQVLNNLALLEMASDPQAAKALLLEDLELHAVLNDDFGRCVTLINLADIEIEYGSRAEALRLLEEARQLAGQANAIDLFARVMRLLNSINPGELFLSVSRFLISQRRHDRYQGLCQAKAQIYPLSSSSRSATAAADQVPPGHPRSGR